MSNRPEQQQNRRELCRDTLRYLAAGGIALFSAGLIVKGAGRSAKGRCAKSLACRDCAALAGCDLPMGDCPNSRVNENGTVPFDAHSFVGCVKPPL